MGREEGGSCIDGVTGGAVYDARFVLTVFQKCQELLLDPGFCLHLIEEVGPVEGSAHELGIPQPDFGDDILLDLLRGRGGEGGDRDAGKVRRNRGQRQVVGPEIVAPLGNAVRLVNRKKREGNALQRLDELRHGKPFRRDVKDLYPVVFQIAVNPRYLLLVEGAVHEGRGNAVHPRRIHLVLHERDQGADDDGRSLHQKRGQLVAQGLASARGHDREDVLFVQNSADDRLLVRPEGLETEDRAEGLVKRGLAGA